MCPPPKKALRFFLATENRKRLRFCLRFFEEKKRPHCGFAGGVIARPPPHSPWATAFRQASVAVHVSVCVPSHIVCLSVCVIVSRSVSVALFATAAEESGKITLKGTNFFALKSLLVLFFGALPVTGRVSTLSVLRFLKVTPLRGGAAHGPRQPAFLPSP